MKVGPREALLLSILVALPVASYFLVFRPQNREISQAREEIAHKRSLLQKVQESTSRAETLEKQIADTQEKIMLIEAKLPSKKEVDSVVRSISDLAVQCGLESPNIESDKPVSAAMYMEQPLKVKIKGPFRSEDGEKGFNAFLVKLEQLPRITRMPDLKIGRVKDNNGHMEAAFTLSIYFRPEGSEK